MESKTSVPDTNAENKPARDFAEISRRILRLANQGLPRFEFVREISGMLLDFSGCDEIELKFRGPGPGYRSYRRRCADGGRETFAFDIDERIAADGGGGAEGGAEGSFLEGVYVNVMNGVIDGESPHYTRGGTFWTGDADKAIPGSRTATSADDGPQQSASGYKSLAVIPFVVDEENRGLLSLKSKRKYFFTESEIGFYENLAQMLGISVADRRAQYALRERIKELTCLYEIAALNANPGASVDDILKGIVDVLAPAMQYPDLAAGRITLDGKVYDVPGFPEEGPALSAPIIVGGDERGEVAVAYKAPAPLWEAGPFLPEEENLLNAVARQVATLLERRLSEENEQRLQEQLRHADRLATIGQLAAGVAHELNEPLASILGFAQLASKVPGLPALAVEDLERVVNASLHAREVVKKLLIFARQMPTRKTFLDLNKIINDSLYFLESRCAKEGIELVRDLDPALPALEADPSQLQQVLVNLAVNAVQAMPGGGKLTITTRTLDDEVQLTVADTGAGMDEEVLRLIFVPFFTTKEVGQGTGLGLPVVHGIVTSHGGEINVSSEAGRGSRFDIRLPLTGNGKRGDG